MDHAVIQNEGENKKKGIIVSFMIHALLLLIALVPYLTSEQAQEEISGIVVAFGIPEGGSSDANPLAKTDEPLSEEAPKEESSTDTKKESKSTSKQKETADPIPNKKPTSDLKPISSTSDVAVEEAQKEKARKEAEAAEAEIKRRQAEELARIEAQKKSG